MERRVIAAAPILEGTLVRLRPLTQDDLPLLLRWYTDPEVIHWLHQSEYREGGEERIRAKFGPGSERADDVRWIIEAIDGTPIGVIRLEGIEGAHRRAELAVSIGEKAYWSHGYGTEAIKLALRHGFEGLELRRVHLITDVDNQRGIRCYEKCGFRREGLLRAHRVRYGEPLDMVVMGVLREEWQAEGSRGES
jgi:RimJ/RimL family protein N-acetyltransferase